MPLLKGKLDPQRFNAETIARELCKANDFGDMWPQYTEAYRKNMIAVVQRMLDTLVDKGIIE